MRQEVVDAIDKEVNRLMAGIVVSLTDAAEKGYVAGRMRGRAKVEKVAKKQLAQGATLSIAFNPQKLTEAAKAYAKWYEKNLLLYGRIVGNVIHKNDDGTIDMVTEEIPWLKNASRTAKEDITNIIQRGIKEGKYPGIRESEKGTYPKGTIAYDLQEYADQWKSRASTIARTESARHIWAGQHQQYVEDGVGSVKWLCGADPCPVCEQLCGEIFNIDEVIDIPVHPNCTCDTAPIWSRSAMTETEIKNYNENHDELGRFAEAAGGGIDSIKKMWDDNKISVVGQHIEYVESSGQRERDRMAYNETIKNLTPPKDQDTDIAVRNYTALSAWNMNASLRGKDVVLTRHEKEGLGLLTQHIQDQSPIAAGEVFYRGVGSEGFIDKLKVGDVCSDKGFQSASKSLVVASRFSGIDEKRTGGRYIQSKTFLRLITSGTQKGAMGAKAEGEVIFQRGTRWQVVDVSKTVLSRPNEDVDVHLKVISVVGL